MVCISGRFVVAFLCTAIVLYGCAGDSDRESDQARLPTSHSQLRRGVVGEESRFVLGPDHRRFSVSVPTAASLRFGFGVAAAAWKRGLEEIELTVSFRSGDERTVLFSGRHDSNSRDKWKEVSVPVRSIVGRPGELHLDARVTRGRAPREEEIFWAPPRLRSRDSRKERRPNIVLISIDTLRADHLGSYGYGRETSPNIDRLAQEGVLFTQAIASSSWTVPSHASMFTGLHPSHHGSVKFPDGPPLRDGLPTVTEILWDEGYRTAGITGGAFVSYEYGFDRGFDSYSSHAGPQSAPLRSDVLEAIRWIGNTEAPFFLFLHTYAVHAPYRPPARYRAMFTDRHYEGPFKFGFAGQGYAQGAMGRHHFDGRTVRHLQDLYDAGIRHADAVLGKLFDFLRTPEGQRSPTCVVVVSDHGEEFDEHGHILHRQPELYEELIRVPLIVWCPQLYPGGRVVDQVVSHVDLMPTLLDIARVDTPDGLDGISLEPMLSKDVPTPQRFVFSSADRSLIYEDGTVDSVRTGRHKLIVASSGPPVLFDLVRDPGETQPISRPEIAARMQDRLQDFARLAAPARAAGPAKLDAEVVKRMRALGYVE